jgi:hypothetical protein
MQPMVAFKNALQEGRPLPRSPLALYRGLVVGGGGALQTHACRARWVRLPALPASTQVPVSTHGL